MGKLATRIALLATVAVVGSCSTVSYISDWDTQRDFSGDDTFAWFELAPNPKDGPAPVPGNQLVAERIRRSVTAELRGKGMESAPPEEAELLVSYFVVLQPRMVMYHTGWAYPYWWGWGWGSSHARTYTEGTLVVDVLDADSRQLVWRGMAAGAFTRPNPSDEHVARVAARLMADFPPR